MFFNVPANSALILQRGNALISMGAGQHVVTNPTTTFRGFFPLGERYFYMYFITLSRQHTITTEPALTLESVPVVLSLNLRYKVVDPEKLTLNVSFYFVDF
jgi:regulator of protease activity HflC (stomatin/prohibitin superfamily)